METKIEIKSVFGSVLFELEKEDNTIKDTLIEAIKSSANLCNADLCGAKNIPFIPTYLPDGEFIGWKKLPNGLIAKLKIFEDSKRSRGHLEDNGFCWQCRISSYMALRTGKNHQKQQTGKCID